MATSGYEFDQDDEDFLRNFGIYFPNTSDSGSGSSAQPQIYNADGTRNTSARNTNGTPIVYRGDGNNGTISGKTYVNIDLPDDRPYLINKDRLELFGLDDSFLNSIIYKEGNNYRIYKPNEVSENIPLKRRMDDVTRANNSAKSMQDI